MAKRWTPTAKTLDNVIKRVKVGDAISNPVCAARTGTHAKRSAAYQLADRIDAKLDAKGLRIDNTALCIGYVERK
jgi:hypothetical protein